jgi:hypothetical protein
MRSSGAAAKRPPSGVFARPEFARANSGLAQRIARRKGEHRAMILNLILGVAFLAVGVLLMFVGGVFGILVGVISILMGLVLLLRGYRSRATLA